MNWDSIVGQQPAKKYLRAVIGSRRLSHAYLFQGPVGVGKRSTALLYAQILMCQQRPAPDASCGQCRSCRWFAARQGHMIDHPDVISLLKFSGGSRGEGATEKLVGDQDPIIKLETIQHVCEQLHRSPMSGGKRVVIIPEAQRMCRGQAEAANAFLKTLEEPPASSLVILTSSQPEALLETIISRVQVVQFRRLSIDEIRTGLATQLPSKPEAERELAATLADGSLGRAKELLDGELRRWRDAVLVALDKFTVRSGPTLGLMLWKLAEAEGLRLLEAEKGREKEEAGGSDESDDSSGENTDEAEVKTEAGWKRYVFRRLLEIVEVCFRDALVCASAPETGGTLLLQPDQLKLAQTLAQKFGREGCEKALTALRDAFLATRLYVRGDLVGRAFAGKLVEAAQSAA